MRGLILLILFASCSNNKHEVKNIYVKEPVVKIPDTMVQRILHDLKVDSSTKKQ